MESNNEIKLYNKSQKLFKAKTYIQGEQITLDLESDKEKYLRKYNFEQLISVEKYFRQADDLEEALSYLKNLFEGEYSIEEKENCLILTFKYIKRDIKFILDKIDENVDVDISYEHLSFDMKKYVDNNRLVLGIDLGTTYSCAAVMIENNIIMIRNSLGLTTTPSYIYFLNKDKAYVGELVKLLPSNEDKNIIYNIKRILGRNIDDKEIKQIRGKLPFNLKKDEDFNLLKIGLNFNNNEEDFYPEQISALILKKIVEDSEFYLSKKIGKHIKINECVITVPAYFNQKQRESTYNSAKILGLDVKTLINEPTAASLAYFYKSLENAHKNIIVIDFGGGTLDITLLEYTRDKNGIYCEVKFTYGNTNFGGEDFDNILISYCIKKLKDGHKDININPKDIRLKRACERAKKKLSTYEGTHIFIGNCDLPIKRSDFIEESKKLFEDFKNILNDFIKESNVGKDNISEVILIGGSTLIPKIREIIKEKFDKSEVRIHLDPKEVVAMGAAIRGAKYLNLSSVSNIHLFDVTNISLGIRKIGNIFCKILPRSTKIPKDNTHTFETVEDNQTKALIQIYEGESIEKCDEKNLLLGKFEISGFPERKAGKVKIEINMNIKTNLILEVTAWQKDNELNNGYLEIKKLNDLPKILNELMERHNRITFFENRNYNDIKFYIIESEEELVKEKGRKVKDDKIIKSSYKNILLKIGDFLKKNNNLSNLYISLIKYYFNKMCDFFQKCKTDKEDEKEINEIKASVPIIFEKIQFNCLRDLMFEIVEEIVDHDNVIKYSIDYIIQSLWDEIYTIFTLTKINDNYEESLKNLSRINSLADTCKQIIEEFDKEKIKINIITTSDIENIKLKILVRETIIRKKKNANYSDDITLNELYNKYINCTSFVEEDLEELGSIVGFNVSRFYIEFEKAQKFMKWVNQKKDSDNINEVVEEILENYPYDINDYDKYQKFETFAKFKHGKIQKEKYLDIIRGQYSTLLTADTTSDIDKNVYEAILRYLNKIS